MRRNGIRPAVPEDSDAILAVYAPFVADTVVSFELAPPAREAFAERVAGLLERYPYLVHETDGRVDGYAYAHAYAERGAYRYTVETSIYLAPAARRRGLGRALYGALFGELRARGFRTVMAGITVPNPASEAFHAALGFARVGLFRRIGYKFGRWLDVSWWQRDLDGFPGAPPEPRFAASPGNRP